MLYSINTYMAEKRGKKTNALLNEINRAFVINIYPAASYSPRPLPAKYHQRWRA